MYEVAFISLCYLLGAELWWLMAIAIILNRFIKKPLLILMVFSPIFWLFALNRNIYTLIHKFFYQNRFSATDQILFYITGLVICFTIYFILYNFYKLIDKEAKHPLPYLILFWFLLIFINYSLRSPYLTFIPAMGSLIFIFFSNAFFIIAYELKNSRRQKNLKIHESFSLLNTMHFNSFLFVSTQLSPKGSQHLVDGVVENKKLKNLQLMSIKLLGLCVAVKVLTTFIGHLLLNVENSYWTNLHLPMLSYVDLMQYQTTPRYFVMNHSASEQNVYFAIIVRSFHWFAERTVGWNSKIAVLWFLGIYIELGVLNPFKSSSFVDFFRRAHVYVADFYRVFIYKYLSGFFSFIKNPNLKKYICIWFMIYIGGFVFQTISHYYTIFSWSFTDYVIAMKARAFYDGVLATTICVGLFCEKKFPNSSNKIRLLRTFIYIISYSFLMSMSSSLKSPNFSLNSLFRYFQILLGQN